MTTLSLVTAIALRKGKIIKRVFERGDNLLQNSNTTLCIYVKPIVRNRVTKLEFRQTKCLKGT